MWILILTILGYSSQSGQSVTGVPGFTSEKACMVAANAWVKHTATVENSSNKLAICVKA